MPRAWVKLPTVSTHYSTPKTFTIWTSTSKEFNKTLFIPLSSKRRLKVKVNRIIERPNLNKNMCRRKSKNRHNREQSPLRVKKKLRQSNKILQTHHISTTKMRIGIKRVNSSLTKLTLVLLLLSTHKSLQIHNSTQDKLRINWHLSIRSQCILKKNTLMSKSHLNSALKATQAKQLLCQILRTVIRRNLKANLFNQILNPSLLLKRNVCWSSYQYFPQVEVRTAVYFRLPHKSFQSKCRTDTSKSQKYWQPQRPLIFLFHSEGYPL